MPPEKLLKCCLVNLFMDIQLVVADRHPYDRVGRRKFTSWALFLVEPATFLRFIEIDAAEDTGRPFTSIRID